MSYEEALKKIEKRNFLLDCKNEIRFCKKVLNDPNASELDKESARNRIRLAEEKMAEFKRREAEELKHK